MEEEDPPGPSSGRRPDKTAKNAHNKSHIISIRKCFLGHWMEVAKKTKFTKRQRLRKKKRWKGFCRSPVIAEAVERGVQFTSHVIVIASRLLNLHCLRSLDANSPIHVVTQDGKATSLYNGLVNPIFAAARNIVSGKIRFSTDDAINASAIALHGIITREGRHLDFPSYEPWMDRLVQAAGKKHATNVENHLKLNTPSYCKRFFKGNIVVDLSESPLSRGALLKNTAAAAFKALSEDVPFNTAIQSFKKLRELGMHVLDAAYIQGLIDELVPFFRPEKQDKDLVFWNKIRLFHHILRKVESCSDEIREHNAKDENKEKLKSGKLVFDLLPVAKLRAKYVEINHTVLHSLVEALAREPKKKVALVYEGLDHSKFAEILERCSAQETKKSKERMLFLSLFDVKRFEGGGWTFQGTIETDGIHCSVKIEREKTEKELEIDSLTKEVKAAEWEHKEKNATLKARGEKKKNRKKIPEEERLAQLKEERLKGDIQRASNILGFRWVGDEWNEDAAAPIGLDPGKTSLFTTAVHSGAAEKSIRQRNEETGCVGAPSEESVHFVSKSMSQSEYYKRAGFNKRASVLKRHVESVPTVRRYNEGGAESSKTADVDRYSESLHALFGVYNDLMNFYSRTRWWRRSKAGTHINTADG